MTYCAKDALLHVENSMDEERVYNNTGCASVVGFAACRMTDIMQHG